MAAHLIVECSRDQDGNCTVCGYKVIPGDTRCLKSHILGANYSVPVDGNPITESKLVIHCRRDGIRCSICGSIIPDGDDICPQGHEIGMWYQA